MDESWSHGYQIIVNSVTTDTSVTGHAISTKPHRHTLIYSKAYTHNEQRSHTNFNAVSKQHIQLEKQPQ